MRRMKNFMFSGLLLAAVSVSAEVPPSIHVDGKNLTDTHGNKRLPVAFYGESLLALSADETGI